MQALLRSQTRRLLLPASVLLATLALPTPAGAAAWGDATLVRDDVRIAIDRRGQAEITHTVTLRVTGRRFRAFVLDGVDEGAGPPLDAIAAADRDGPAWAIRGTDAKGIAIEGLVEPAKEPRKLRVRLGVEGVPRGEYAVVVRYRTDLAARGSFERDGAMLRLSWTAPRWSEGYDAGRVVFAVPEAPTEPTLMVGSPADAGEHAPDGIAVLARRREGGFDEVAIERPHVPPNDDLRWILRIDPKALPTLAPKTAGAPATISVSSPIAGSAHRFGWAAFSALGLGLLHALALVARDRDLRARGFGFRALVPLSSWPRAIAAGIASGATIAAGLLGAPLAALPTLAATFVLSTLRPLAPPARPRRPGRWLSIPDPAQFADAARPAASRFDPAGRRGKVLLAAASASTLVAIAVAARFDMRLAAAIAIATPGWIPLFASGGARQLATDDPGSLLAESAALLRTIERHLRRKQAREARARRGGRMRPMHGALHVRFIARSTTLGVDELRLRIERRGHAEGSAAIDSSDVVEAIEIGCGRVETAAGRRLVPELLVRLRGEVPAAAADNALIQVLPGRDEGAVVLSIRPVASTPRAIGRWVDWALALDARPTPAAAPRPFASGAAAAAT
jgi:hypothetical protein